MIGRFAMFPEKSEAAKLVERFAEVVAERDALKAERDELDRRWSREWGKLKTEVKRLRTALAEAEGVEAAEYWKARAEKAEAENQRLRAALHEVIRCDHHVHRNPGDPPSDYVQIARAALKGEGNGQG